MNELFIYLNYLEYIYNCLNEEINLLNLYHEEIFNKSYGYLLEKNLEDTYLDHMDYIDYIRIISYNCKEITKSFRIDMESRKIKKSKIQRYIKEILDTIYANSYLTIEELEVLFSIFNIKLIYINGKLTIIDRENNNITCFTASDGINLYLIEDNKLKINDNIKKFVDSNILAFINYYIEEKTKGNKLSLLEIYSNYRDLENNIKR